MNPVVGCTRVGLGALLAISVLVGACGAPRPLPPEQRNTVSSRMQPISRPEGYRVVRGDTLYSIAFRYGLDWRELARWNELASPYTIRVDDWIRLHPPPDMQVAVTVPEPESETVSESESAPPQAPPPARAEPAPEPSARGAPESPAPEREPVAEVQPSTDSTDPPGAPMRAVAGVRWRWPTEGRVVRSFDAQATRKGILIAGETGQPVRAAANGEVVYSGDGLIGYGELIIVKHSERMLSAYAHNRQRLVAEGARVRAGQMIARMGRNERDDAVLHFEVRRDGRPENPIDFLPQR